MPVSIEIKLEQLYIHGHLVDREKSAANKYSEFSLITTQILLSILRNTNLSPFPLLLFTLSHILPREKTSSV